MNGILWQDEWRTAREDEFPSIVSVRGIWQQHVCLGVLVDRYHVLTAAHCLNQTGPNPMIYVNVRSTEHRVKVQKRVEYSASEMPLPEITLLLLLAHCLITTSIRRMGGRSHNSSAETMEPVVCGLCALPVGFYESMRVEVG